MVNLKSLILVGIAFSTSNFSVHAQTEYRRAVEYDILKKELGWDMEALDKFDGLAFNHCLSVMANPPPAYQKADTYQQCFMNLKQKYDIQPELDRIHQQELEDEQALELSPEEADLLEIDYPSEPVDKFFDLTPVDDSEDFELDELLEIDLPQQSQQLPLDISHINTDITVARLDDNLTQDLANAERQLLQMQLTREQKEREEAHRLEIARIERAKQRAEAERQAEYERQLAEQREREKPSLLAGIIMGAAGAYIDAEVAGAGINAPSLQRQLLENHFGTSLPAGAAYVEQQRQQNMQFQRGNDCNSIVTRAYESVPNTNASFGMCGTARESQQMYEAVARAYAQCGSGFESERQQMEQAAAQARQSAQAACTSYTAQPSYSPSFPSNTYPQPAPSQGTYESNCVASGNSNCTAK